ncbi:hypothetical protein GWK47_043314 [Chionoecetes opilio]|uniref:Uncharacterized protein n=1 Tax=Chionoecetes opilio TaxID=41210 RepID=A0A8J4YGB0_CHIOP|nr:hypothetical protein GWK47_043314 [Chionoecetes opilio]
MSVSRGGHWSNTESSLAQNISFSSVLRTSVGAYTATRDMKPRVCFILTRIIRSSTGVTSTTDSSVVPSRASALATCHLEKGQETPNPRGEKEGNCSRNKSKRKAPARIMRSRHGQARRPPLQSHRKMRDPGQHKASPRRRERGSEPRSTRLDSTVPLPAPTPRAHAEEVQRRRHALHVTGARGVTRVSRHEDPPEPAGNPPGGEGTTRDSVAEQHLRATRPGRRLS